jgi:nucleotide-binding universal stress UspA family protein
MTTTTLTLTARSYEPTNRQRTGPVIVALGPGYDEPVLDAARILAPRLGGDVTAVTALEPLPLYGAVHNAPLPAEIEEARIAAMLERVRWRIHDVGGPGAKWPIELQFGPPARVIADLARDRHARLVVMGIGRRNPIDRLFGETAVQTVRLARRPVLAVTDFWALPRRVVAAVDFSASSVAAVKTALPLLADDATIFLVHVWQRSDLPHPVLQARDAEYERRLPELLARVEREISAPAGITVKAVPLVGKPTEEVLAFAEGHDADLIVTGTHGRGFVERLFLGSVATGLLRRATCSVLTAPEPPLADVDRIERHVTGTYESHSPDAWAVQLEGFARRNADRRTALEVDDPRLGAQVQQTGYALLGATYDPHDRRVELMLGDPAGGTAHLTRTIDGVESVAVATGPTGRDEALRITQDHAQTLLTFLGTDDRP